MSDDELVQIRVNQQSVGIIGLKRVVQEMSEEYRTRPDSEVRAELVKRVSRKNYIPDAAKEAYGKALLREFNKLLGRPYEEESSEALEIKILGPGCARCDSLARKVMEVVAEMKFATAVEHVRDAGQISRYGVMGTPALVINTKVVSVGTVPSKAKIKQWLNEFEQHGDK